MTGNGATWGEGMSRGECRGMAVMELGEGMGIVGNMMRNSGIIKTSILREY